MLLVIDYIESFRSFTCYLLFEILCEYMWLLSHDADFPGQNFIECEKLFYAHNEPSCLCIYKMHRGGIRLAFQIFNTCVCSQDMFVDF